MQVLALQAALAAFVLAALAAAAGGSRTATRPRHDRIAQQSSRSSEPAKHTGDGDIRMPACADHSDLTKRPNPGGKGGCTTPIVTPADWAVRRADIVTGFQAAAGTMPPRSSLPPLNLTMVATVVLPGGVVRRSITFAGAHDDQMPVPAYLLIPPNASSSRPSPCVLASHPTSVAGKGYASIRAPPLNYGVELAERGFVVIQPDYPSMGGMAGYNFATSPFASGTMKAVFDNTRAVDVLETLDFADATRVAAIGHSLGGHNSLFTAVVDERVGVVVSSCGWTPWAYYVNNTAPLATSWALPKYMPRIASVFNNSVSALPFDFDELVAAVAPRPFFSNSPFTDFNFNVSGVFETLPKVRPVWDLLGASEALHVTFPSGGCMAEGGSHDCGHDFPAGTRWEAYDFIERHLGHPPAARSGPRWPGAG